MVCTHPLLSFAGLCWTLTYLLFYCLETVLVTATEYLVV